MKNGAYRLAFLSAVSGLVLLLLSEPGTSLYPSLGTALLLAAVVIGGVGKVVEWLGYVRDGAVDHNGTDERR